MGGGIANMQIIFFFTWVFFSVWRRQAPPVPSSESSPAGWQERGQRGQSRHKHRVLEELRKEAAPAGWDEEEASLRSDDGWDFTKHWLLTDKRWDMWSGVENAASQLSFEAWALASCGAALRSLLLTSNASLGSSLSLHTLIPEMDTIRGPVSQAVLKGQRGYWTQ